MSEERYQWTTEYDMEPVADEEELSAEEPAVIDDEIPEVPEPEPDPEFEAKLRARIRKYRRRKTRRKYLTVLAVILAFALMFTMCGREIVRLKAENYALKKQQKELEAERDRLAKELEHVEDKEYIKNQARKQLRLLDPGEIMFVFEEDTEVTEEEGGETVEETQTENEEDHDNQQ